MGKQDVIQNIVRRFLRKTSYSRKLVEIVRYNLNKKSKKDLGTIVYESVYSIDQFKIIARSLRNTDYDCRKNPNNIFLFLDKVIEMKKDEIRTSKN